MAEAEPIDDEEAFGITDRLVSEVMEAVERDDGAFLTETLDSMHPADVAHLLEQIDTKDRRALLTAWPGNLEGEVLSELDEELREEVIGQLDPEELADAVRDLERSMPGTSRDLGDAHEESAPVSNFTREGYKSAVEKAREYIVAGDIFQVVPSQRWAQGFSQPPFALYRSLRRTNPSPFMFYFNFGDFHVVGASPEILVRVFGNEITIRPVAGTRRRGATPEEDRALEADLLADQKELAEHLMLLDLGRNDVGRVAKIGTVRPTEEFIVERYSHVMHIVSNVVGELREDRDALDAFFAGMPAGTVSGAPKVRAMEIIDELEPEKRGLYGGGVGYFSAGGDMDMCIALRTAVIKDKTLYIQAGGGVVYDSDAEAEYMETVHKSDAIRRAAADAARFAGQGNS